MILINGFGLLNYLALNLLTVNLWLVECMWVDMYLGPNGVMYRYWSSISYVSSRLNV